MPACADVWNYFSISNFDMRRAAYQNTPTSVTWAHTGTADTHTCLCTHHTQQYRRACATKTAAKLPLRIKGGESFIWHLRQVICQERRDCSEEQCRGGYRLNHDYYNIWSAGRNGWKATGGADVRLLSGISSLISVYRKQECRECSYRAPE